MGCAVAAKSGLSALLFGGLALLPGRADAQVGPDDSGVAIAGAGVFHSVPRSGLLRNNQLSRADCEGDDIIYFPLLLTNPGNDTLEVWAGVGCQADANRITADLSQCWKLFSAPASSETMSVKVHARDILVGYTRSATTVVSSPDAGGPLPVGDIVSGTGRAACDYSLPIVAAYQLYFMLTDPTRTALGTIATWTGQFKLLGPPPPDELDVTAGSNSLALHISYFNDQTTDTTITGYRFFCDPAPGAAANAPASADAGCAESAPSTALVPRGMADAKYVCGSTSISLARGTASGLANGSLYHVAVAAVDTYENLGPLSNVACAIPRPADETANACSFSARGRGRPSQWGMPLLAITLALRQRARRRARARGAARPAQPRSARSWRRCQTARIETPGTARSELAFWS